MSTILVTGAGGGLGSNVVRAALARGHRVRALVRDPKQAQLPEGVAPFVGDALDPESMRRAADGCEALFHLANVVIGDDWVRLTAALLDAAIAACASTGARLVFPANVWVFGRGTPGALVSEAAPLTPCSKLGDARRRKEEKIRGAGIRWAMIRLPEFYGPHVQTLTGRPLQAISRGERGRWWGPADHSIEFVYMPDAADVLVVVGLSDAADGELFHLPGVAHTTARDFLASAVRIAGTGRFAVMPAFLVRAGALVNPLARSFADILHLWEHPILLDGTKLRTRFPALKMTSYDDGIAATLAWYRARPDARVY
jgi:nucleoside-diphosphate-sugar epimerase